jgi:uncharacterized protein (TIGR04255 family)
MPRNYKNPPVAEALCEFLFEPSQPWDWTLPGLMYAEMKRDFPKKRQQTVQLQLQLGVIPFGGQGVAAPSLTPTPALSRLQFLTEDEKTLVQVGPDVLTVNKLKPYSSWGEFKPLIRDALAVYSDIAKPKCIRRLGLRYINRIEIPAGEVDVEQYLLAHPRIPESMPQRLNSWVQRAEIPISDHGVLVLQSGSVREPGNANIVFMLDLDFGTVQGSLPAEAAMERVEAAHQQVESAFEACVTAKARLLFKEVV